jgi:hypothetical protein
MNAAKTTMITALNQPNISTEDRLILEEFNNAIVDIINAQILPNTNAQNIDDNNANTNLYNNISKVTPDKFNQFIKNVIRVAKIQNELVKLFAEWKKSADTNKNKLGIEFESIAIMPIQRAMRYETLLKEGIDKKLSLLKKEGGLTQHEFDTETKHLFHFLNTIVKPGADNLNIATASQYPTKASALVAISLANADKKVRSEKQDEMKKTALSIIKNVSEELNSAKLKNLEETRESLKDEILKMLDDGKSKLVKNLSKDKRKSIKELLKKEKEFADTEQKKTKKHESTDEIKRQRSANIELLLKSAGTIPEVRLLIETTQLEEKHAYLSKLQASFTNVSNNQTASAVMNSKDLLKNIQEELTDIQVNIFLNKTFPQLTISSKQNASTVDKSNEYITKLINELEVTQNIDKNLIVTISHEIKLIQNDENKLMLEKLNEILKSLNKLPKDCDLLKNSLNIQALRANSESLIFYKLNLEQLVKETKLFEEKIGSLPDSVKISIYEGFITLLELQRDAAEPGKKLEHLNDKISEYGETCDLIKGLTEVTNKSELKKFKNEWGKTSQQIVTGSDKLQLGDIVKPIKDAIDILDKEVKVKFENLHPVIKARYKKKVRKSGFVSSLDPIDRCINFIFTLMEMKKNSDDYVKNLCNKFFADNITTLVAAIPKGYDLDMLILVLNSVYKKEWKGYAADQLVFRSAQLASKTVLSESAFKPGEPVLRQSEQNSAAQPSTATTPSPSTPPKVTPQATTTSSEKPARPLSPTPSRPSATTSTTTSTTSSIKEAPKQPPMPTTPPIASNKGVLPESAKASTDYKLVSQQKRENQLSKPLPPVPLKAAPKQTPTTSVYEKGKALGLTFTPTQKGTPGAPTKPLNESHKTDQADQNPRPLPVPPTKSGGNTPTTQT